MYRAVLFDKLNAAKMHGLDTSNVSSRVVSRREEPNEIWALTHIGSRIRVSLSSRLFRSTTHIDPVMGNFFKSYSEPGTRDRPNYQAETSPMVRDDDVGTPELKWRHGEGIKGLSL